MRPLLNNLSKSCTVYLRPIIINHLWMNTTCFLSDCLIWDDLGYRYDPFLDASEHADTVHNPCGVSFPPACLMVSNGVSACRVTQPWCLCSKPHQLGSQTLLVSTRRRGSGKNFQD